MPVTVTNLRARGPDGSWVDVSANADGELVVTNIGGGGAASEVRLTADARAGGLMSGLWTLGSTGAPETIAIPDEANGFRLRPTADIRFAIDEAPAVNAGETLTVGNTAYAAENEVRLLVSGTGRELQLLAITAGTTVEVSFF